MAKPRVIAVILSNGDGHRDAPTAPRTQELAPTIEAVELQSSPVDRILVTAAREPIHTGLDGRWVWLLDGGVVPDRFALESLVGAAASVSPAPVLIASRILTADGVLDEASVPVPEVHKPERVLAALERRLVPLRAARSGSVLVDREALDRDGPLTADEAVDRDLEWSARLLGKAVGLLAPSSVAVRRDGPRRAPAASVRVSSTVRLLAELAPRERLWFATHLGERAIASLRARPIRARG